MKFILLEVKFEVFTVMKIDFMVFWVAEPLGLKTEAVWSSKMLVSNHHTIQQNNPDNHKFFMLLVIYVLKFCIHIPTLTLKFGKNNLLCSQTHVIWR